MKSDFLMKIILWFVDIGEKGCINEISIGALTLFNAKVIILRRKKAVQSIKKANQTDQKTIANKNGMEMLYASFVSLCVGFSFFWEISWLMQHFHLALFAFAFALLYFISMYRELAALIVCM